MNFKSSDQLIARVNKQLNSFKSSGLLDEGDYYRWIKEILTMLNIPSFSPVHSIIPVMENKINIPDDMYQLWSVWRYEEENPHYTPPVKHLQREVRWLVQEDKIQSTCEEDCNTITHESDMMITKYYIEEHKPIINRYTNRQPIRVVNYTVNRCNGECPALTTRSRFEASMDSNYFYFNFTGGSIYLQYYKLALDDNGLPMIPDVSEIELAIENYIVFRFFQEMYYNNTMDALQRMQYAQQEYIRTFDKAKSWVKTPTARELYRIAQKNRGKFNRFELKHSRD